MAKPYSDNPQSVQTPTDTAYMGIEQGGTGLEYMKKIQVSNLLSAERTRLTNLENNKADASTTYTKTQVDNLLANKANSVDVYTKTETYTQTEIDNALADKQDKAIVIDGESTTVESAVQANFESIATVAGRQNVVLENEVENGDVETALPYTSSIFGDSVGAYALNTSSPISGEQDSLLTVTTQSTSTARPFLGSLDFKSDLVIGDVYCLAFKYKVNSGTCILNRIYNGITTEVIAETFETSGIFAKTVECISDNSAFLNIYFDGTNTFNVQIDNYQVLNLTKIFANGVQGTGLEPTADEMKALINIIGYVDEEYILTNLDMINWMLSLIRANSTAITELGAI